MPLNRCALCLRNHSNYDVRNFLVQITESGSFRETTICIDCAGIIAPGLMAWLELREDRPERGK